MKKLITLWVLITGLLIHVHAQDYKDPKISIDERINDLLSRMTLQEKVNQLISCRNLDSTEFDNKGNYKGTVDTTLLHHSIGYISIEKFDLSVEKQALMANGLQKYCLENSRLQIPCLSLSEGLHGFMARGATSFPQAIALASTWDTVLVEKVYGVAALEARARGSQEFLSPVIDLGREPRWGRFDETYGEDPYLVSRIGLAAVLGFQGRQKTIDDKHVAVTLKHFAGHGQPEGGRNTGPVNFSERLFLETHLYPFEIAVKRGHARSLMASYNEWDEVPNHMNKKLLTDILRKEWGFDGYVMSDGGGIADLYKVHFVAKTPAEAGKLAIDAGVDMELAGGNECFSPLFDLVKKGLVDEKNIDRAVRGILRVKFELGLFEYPYVDINHCLQVTNNKEHQELARVAAQKAMILLKNEKNTLPLDASKIKTLAVIGPNASYIHCGSYSAVPHQGISVLDGLKQFAGDRMKITYAEGCKITLNPITNWLVPGNPVLNTPENDQKLIDEAVKTAQNSDAVLLVLGENEITCREAWNEEHLGDRENLDLVGRQNDLAKAILATGKPVVVLLLNGRPLTINYLKANVPAIIEGWYLGQETGHAVADVIFGKVNPSGKLTVTFPRSVGQLPCYYNKRPSQHRSYTMANNKPLFPFGFGLSYTTFDYKNIRLSMDSIAIGQTVKVMVDITNSGKVAGEEIVQMYIHDKIGSLPRPIKELKDFTKITLAPGETQTVTFTITPEKLEFINIDMKRVVEPGEFEIMVGKNSQEFLQKILVVKQE